jgi:hypothetical protein
MTESVTTPLSAYALTAQADGPFETVFGYGAAAEVRVVLLVPGSAAQVLTVGDDYTLAPGATPLEDGGAVTLDASILPAAAWPTGSALVIMRTTPLDQGAALGDLAGVPPSVLEALLNRLVRQVQDVEVRLNRALMFPLNEQGQTVPMPTSRAGMVLAFDGDGDVDLTKSYDQLIEDVAQALPDDVLSAIDAAGGAKVAAVQAAGNAILAPTTGTLAVAEAAALANLDSAADTAIETGTAALEAAAEQQIVAIAATVGGDQYQSTADAVSNGVWSVAVTAAGSGGVNGDYSWSTTGGGGTNAAGYLTVAGGAIAEVVVTHRGRGYTSAPTIVIAGSHGVTGHTLAPSISQNEVEGSYFVVRVAGGFGLYRVTTGTTVELLDVYPSLAALSAVLAAFVDDAGGETISSLITETGGSVEYNRDGRLYVGKMLPHPAHAEGVYYIQTGASDTNAGIITNDVQILTRVGHAENDYGIRSSFLLLDQRTATSTGSRRENSVTWTEASLVQFRPGGDLYNPTLVELMVGTGLQGVILLEESSGGLSIDNGQTVFQSFMGSGHGGVFAVEDFVILADGVPININSFARYQARHVSILTKERYYRNRAGAITVANPVAIVENEFEFIDGIMRLSSTVRFEQDLTGGMYGHATTVPTAAFANLARYADQRRRFSVNDYVGAGGANLEASTRDNVYRVTYDDPVHGGLDIARTVCERYAPGAWPKPSGRLDFGINRATLKVTDDRKTYFELGGSVAGAYYKFSSGEVVKVVTEYRISPPWSNADAG